jgi:hypothetical protein
MGDWPGYSMPPLNIITPWSEDSLGQALGPMSAAAAIGSGTVGQGNIEFYPFVIHQAVTAYKMFTITGTTQNGSMDVGIYDHEFNLIVSIGSTAQGAANTLQEFNIADTVLNPGHYWMAFVLNSATGTFFRHAPADEFGVVAWSALVQNIGSSTLPDPATPVRHTGTSQNIIVMGVSFETLI